MGIAHAIWKAIDHARDEDGKFAKKGTGTFVTGGANKATPGVYTGAAGKGVNGQYHVGGATVQDPQGKDTGHDIDWSLAPGAKVHPVTGGTKEQVLVHHPDNTKTLLSATPKGQEPKTEKVFGAHEDAAGQLKKDGMHVGKPLDQHPDAAGTTYETEIAHKVGGVKQLDAMGTGAKVTIKGQPGSGVTYTYQKQTDGTWVRIGKDAPAAGQQTGGPDAPQGKPVAGTAALNKLPTGAQVSLTQNTLGSPPTEHTFVKQADGSWAGLGKDGQPKTSGAATSSATLTKFAAQVNANKGGTLPGSGIFQKSDAAPAPSAKTLASADVEKAAKELGADITQDHPDAGDATPDSLAAAPPGAKVKLHSGVGAISSLTKGEGDVWTSDSTGLGYAHSAVAAYAAGHSGGKVEHLGPPPPKVVPPAHEPGSQAHLDSLPTGAKIGVQDPAAPGEHKATFTKQPGGKFVNDKTGVANSTAVLAGLYGPGPGYTSHVQEIDTLPGSDKPEPAADVPDPKAPQQGSLDFAKIPDVEIGEPPLPPGKKVATGMVVREPDGRVWIYEPKGHFAGYEHSWPKGTMDKGSTLSGQQNAHKEVHEETGLTAKIVGFLGDYDGSTMGSGSVTRMYLAERVGGTPHADDPTPFVEGGNEAAAVKLVTPEEAAALLNKDRDKKILADALAKVPQKTAPAPAAAQPVVPGLQVDLAAVPSPLARDALRTRLADSPSVRADYFAFGDTAYVREPNGSLYSLGAEGSYDQGHQDLAAAEAAHGGPADWQHLHDPEAGKNRPFNLSGKYEWYTGAPVATYGYVPAWKAKKFPGSGDFFRQDQKTGLWHRILAGGALDYVAPIEAHGVTTDELRAQAGNTKIQVWDPAHGTKTPLPNDYQWAPTPTPPSDPTPQADGTPAVPGADGGPQEVFDHALHHPSGATVPLVPGDEVYRHKKVTTSYLIGHADGGWEKVDKNGKVVKPQGFLVDKLAAKYDHVHTEPASDEYQVPGTNAVLKPGEELWASNGNTAKWAVADGTKVTKLIHKETGEVTKPNHNWQKSYAKGGVLVPMGKHPGLEEDQHSEVDDALAAAAQPEAPPGADLPDLDASDDEMFGAQDPVPAETLAAIASAKPGAQVIAGEGGAAGTDTFTLKADGKWHLDDSTEPFDQQEFTQNVLGELDASSVTYVPAGQGGTQADSTTAAEVPKPGALDPAWTKAAKPGAKVTLFDPSVDEGDDPPPFTKQPDGTWSNGTAYFSDDEVVAQLADATDYGLQVKTADAPASPKITKADAQAAPEGSVFTPAPGDPLTAQVKTWTKHGGLWSGTTSYGAVSSLSDADIENMGFAAGAKIVPPASAPADAPKFADGTSASGWAAAAAPGAQVMVPWENASDVWTKGEYGWSSEATPHDPAITDAEMQIGIEKAIADGYVVNQADVPKPNAPQAPGGTNQVTHPGLDEIKAMPVGTVLQHMDEGGTDLGSWQKTTNSANGLANLGGWQAIDEQGKPVGGLVPEENIAQNIVGNGSGYVNKGAAAPAPSAAPAPKTKPLAKPKAPKVDLSALSSEYETTGGKTLQLTPGEQLVGVSDAPDAPAGASYLLIPNGGSGAKFLNSYGEELPASYQPKGKHSAQKWAAQGGVPLAAGPAKEDVKIPAAEPSEQWDAQKLLAASDGGDGSSVNNLLAQAIKAQVDTNSLGPIGVLSSPEIAAIAAQVKANLDAAAAKWKPALSTQEKSKVTKAQRQVHDFQRVLALGARVTDADTPLTAQDAAEYKDLTKAYQSNGGILLFDQQYAGLKTAWESRKWTEAQQEFDPLSASDEQLTQHVAGKGVPGAAAMTPEQLKAWTLLDMGAPQTVLAANGFPDYPYQMDSSPIGSKEKIEAAANFQLKVKAAAADGAAAAAKQAAVKAPDQTPQGKADLAAAKSVFQTLSDASMSYGNANDDSLFYEDGSWVLADDNGANYVTPEQAAALITSGDWQSEGGLGSVGDYANVAAQALTAKSGGIAWADPDVPYPDELANMIADTSTDYPTNGIVAALEAYAPGPAKTWLDGYLLGDSLMQWHAHEQSTIEVTYTPPELQVVKQALVDWVSQQPWSKNAVSIFPTAQGQFDNPEDLHDAVVALGLDKLNAAKATHGAPYASDAKLWQDWVDGHDGFAGYPNPAVTEATPKVTEPQSFHSGLAQPGDLVLKLDSSDSYFIFPHDLGSGSDTVFLATENGDITELPFSGGWKNAANAQEGFAQSLAQGNAHDVTPNWEIGAALPPAPPPEGVSPEAWQISADPSSEHAQALFAAPPTGAAPSKLDPAQEIAGTALMDSDVRTALLAQHDPDTLAMAAWAIRSQHYNVPAPQKALGKALLGALAQRFKNGDLAPKNPTYVQLPDGHVVVAPKGAEVWAPTSLGGGYPGAVVFPGNPKAGWWINKGGKPTLNTYANGPFDPAGSSWTKVGQNQEDLGPETGAAAGYDFSQSAWDDLAKADTQPADGFNLGTAAYTFKNQNLGADYHGILDAFPTLPDGVKVYAVASALGHDYDSLSALAYKVSTGYYAGPGAPEKHPPLNPKYAPLIAQGKVDSESPYGVAAWPASSIEAFQDDHGLPHGFSQAHFDAIAAKIKDLAPAPAKSPNLKTTSKQADYGALTLTKIPGHDKSHYGGQHVKQGWTDQHGEEWMSKSYTDSASPPQYRVEVEHGANALGRILGFDVGETFVRQDLGGDKHAIVTHIFKKPDGSPLTDLAAVYPEDLNDAQLASTMKSHLLDWMLASYDSHGGNFLLGADGQSIIGIDKSAAFKHHHDDKLAPGYSPPDLPEPSWYDRFYNAVSAGTIDRDRAAKIAREVLLKAHQVSGRSDALVEEAALAALAHRASYNPKFPDSAALAAEVLRRKHDLVADFESMYSSLWAKRGWDLKDDVDTSKFSAKVGQAHVANSAEYAAEVKESSSAGKALLFATTGLQDSHMMMTSMQQEDGGTALIGSAKVSDPELDKKLHAWLQSRVSGNLAYGASKTPPKADPAAQLPLIAATHKANYDYAQTVGSHAPINGNHPDGDYNQSKIDAATKADKILRAALLAVTQHRQSDPTTPFDGGNSKVVSFHTLEQQDAWVAAAQKVLSDHEMVKAAHDAGTKGTWAPDGKLPLAAPTYTPTPDLGQPGQSAEKWRVEETMKVSDGKGGFIGLPAGSELFKTSDGGHYADVDGVNVYLSPQAYAEATAAPDGITSLPVENADGSAGQPSWSNDAGDRYVQGGDGKWTLYDPAGNPVGEVGAYSEVDIQAAMSSEPDAWTYDNGQTPVEQSATLQSGSKTLTISHRKAGGHGGLLDNKTGKLVENKAKAAQAVAGLTHGYEYTIEHGGVTIRYRPYDEPGVHLGQRGQLSFEVRDWAGGHGDIDDVLDTLRLAGIDTGAADETSLELHYWRHLTDEVLANRGDGKNSYSQTPGPIPAKYQKILDQVQQDRAANPNASPEQELESLRSAWAKAIGQDRVDAAIWQPQNVGARGGADEGRPTWLRPDYTLAELKKSYGGGATVPLHKIVVGEVSGDIPNDSPFERSLLIAQSGSLLATEERLRVLGKGLEGMSSKEDQNTGGSSSIFTRQNMRPYSSTYGGGKQNVHLLFDPVESLRTTNYAESWDTYGSLEHQATSAFAPNTMYGWGDDGNELMIRHGATPLAGVYQTQHDRDEAIQRLRELEIEQIGGVPIEEWAITHAQYDARVAAIWAAAEARIEQLQSAYV